MLTSYTVTLLSKKKKKRKKTDRSTQDETRDAIAVLVQNEARNVQYASPRLAQALEMLLIGLLQLLPRPRPRGVRCLPPLPNPTARAPAAVSRVITSSPRRPAAGSPAEAAGVAARAAEAEPEPPTPASSTAASVAPLMGLWGLSVARPRWSL